jgi:methyl-accepting chemotaxis protein
VENFLTIAQIIVLLLLSGVSIYAMVVLVKLRDLLGTIDLNLKEVATRTIPTLENLEVITKKIRVIVENFDDQIAMLNSSVETLKGVADNVAAFERRVQDAIESPIMEVMNSLGGVIRGITSFFNRALGGRSSQYED